MSLRKQQVRAKKVKAISSQEKPVSNRASPRGDLSGQGGDVRAPKSPCSPCDTHLGWAGLAAMDAPPDFFASLCFYKGLPENSSKLFAISLYLSSGAVMRRSQALFGITLYLGGDRKVALRNEDIAMNVLYKTQDAEAFDPDTVPWFEDFPGPTKPKAGPVLNGPLPVNSQFITEPRCRRLYAKLGRDFDLEAAKPVAPEHLYAILERQILPAVKHWAFMGIERLPKIGVVAPWSKDTGGNIPMRYAGPILTDDVGADELGTMLDAAVVNAQYGEIPMTLGHVPIPMFSEIFCIIVRSIDQSTVAHRRFSDRFTGESLRFVFHPEYNHAELFVSPDLSEAIYKGMCWFVAGK